MILSVFRFAAATLLFIVPVQTSFADVYVDPSDPNCASGTGAAGSPVCSIGAAIALASLGDTVRIAPGTYNENVTLPFDLDLVGTGGSAVTFIEGVSGYSPPLVMIPSGVTARIEGLTLQNGGGGAITMFGALTLEDSTIRLNANGIRAFGPGVRLVVSNSELTSNIYPFGGRGAAIFMDRGTCEIRNSTIRGNRAADSGAIDFIGTDPSVHVLEITDSAIESNRAVFLGSGGGIRQSGGRFFMSGSTISGNSTSDRFSSGGGFSFSGGEFEITNSTIASNSTPGKGGGIILGNNVTGLIANSTITRNTSGFSSGGGGLFVSTTAGQVSVRNTIIAENLGSLSNPLNSRDVFGTCNSLGHNLIGEGGDGFTNGVSGDQVGTSVTPLSPLLGPLADYGGSTRTFALLPGSPAIDAGDPTAFELFDQRGHPRPQGVAPDIGAFEVVTDVNSSLLCNGDGGDGMNCTPCPCGNERAAGTIGGCLNSAGTGGRMLRMGSSSASAADLRFEARNLPPNSAAILLSGAALAPANPASPCFGLGSGIMSPTLDGLRCIVQDILRHAVRPADANGAIGVTTSGWGTPNSFFNLSAFTAGQTRYFQVTYRDNIGAVCQTGLNTTQASSVTFVP